MKKYNMSVKFCLFVLFFTVHLHAQFEDYHSVIIDYLNNKKYTANTVKLTTTDLTVPANVDEALNIVGVSVYTLLRNEIYARLGYKFQNPTLEYIFYNTNWYKVKSDFDFSQLNEIELANMNFIKSKENVFDYQVIGHWLDEKGYFGDLELYASRTYYEVPLNVELALNHLLINPSRILRNEIFARHGYIFNDKKLRKIFDRTSWYKGTYSDIKDVIPTMQQVEFVNVELLREREWLEILDSVKFTLPSDVLAIPTLGYNTIFIKKLDFGNRHLHYSSQFISEVVKIKSDIFDSHSSDTNTLVSNEIITKIKNQNDPLKKLVLFFEHKKYNGYVDSLIFNLSDMNMPDYLKEAVKTYGVDYRILLRKEIHARNGARFIDKKSANIFTRCSWYKARYNLTTSTVSRFPNNVNISKKELINFSLLEGEQLYSLYKKHYDKEIVLDLSGNLYFVKRGHVSFDSDNYYKEINLGHGFTNEQDYNKYSVEEIIQGIIKNYNFNPQEYIISEEILEAIGC